ncbi:RNA polymerase sigma factor [Chitinophaga lutea]
MEETLAYGEKELLSRIAEGDHEAFSTIFQTYYPLLFTYIHRITRSGAETESILQDVFLKIWMGREALAYVDRFKPYLWVMARHKALNVMRDTVRRQLALAGYTGEDAGEEEAREKEFRLSLVDSAVEALPEQWREVWLLHRRDRLKQAEIAERMGISLPTVKKYMKQAVGFITRHVKERSGLGDALFIVLSVFFQK